jgi:type VI secretion system protein ImpJ
MSKPLAVEDRIQWHEGMLLSPQHFQLASARVDSLVACHTLLAAPFAWGIRRLKIDSALVPAGIVRLLDLEAIMPDGTAVSYSADNPMHGALELDLAPFAQALGDGPVDFYLVLPLNKNMRDPGTPGRFRSVATAPVEDEVSDALPADIPRLLPNLSLVAGSVPSGLYTSIRLGTLFNDNELIKLGDPLPPMLEIPKEADLWEKVSAFVGQLRGKAAFVAKQTAVPSSRTEDRLAYMEQRERLGNLLAGLPQLEAVLRTPSVHPYALYMALCSLLGPLSMLKPGALPPVPPEYNHADPVSVFRPLLAALHDSLQEVSQDYREHKFEFRYGAFELTLQPEWLTQTLVLGLRGRPEKDLVAWMSGAIVGSQSAYGSLRERRVLGAARSAIEASQELGVRASSGYTLFSIQASPTLTLPNEPLIVSNSAESVTAQRPQEMVLFVKG